MICSAGVDSGYINNRFCQLLNRALVVFISCLILWVCRPAVAIEVENLYQVDIPVADQSDGERNRAFRQGLEEVLVKVTGRSVVTQSPAVTDALSRAGSYMVKFGYHSLPATEQQAEQLMMSVSYSETVVGRLVRQARLPIWPSDRPEMLFWLVTDLAGEGRRHVGRDLMPEAHDQLELAFKRRAEPLLVPLLDLEDQLVLSAKDAWMFNQDQLAAAAKRYGAAHWAVLRFYQANSGAYRGAIQVQAGVHSDLESIDANSIQELVDKAVNIAVDRVAAGYAFVPKVQTEEVPLVLEGIYSHNSYQSSLKTIKALEMIQGVRLAAVNGSELDLRLKIDGSMSSLLDLLRRNKSFEEVADLSSEQTLLRFRWQP